jgi:hypothetical protein
MDTTAVSEDQRPPRRFNWRRFFKWSGAGLILVFLLIQLVPYGRDHSNPPITQAIAWDSAQTEQLARQSCYDCHSNETTWPWYSNVAPVSWLVQRDVDEGRHKLNFSEWDRPQDESDEAAETIREGEMPPWYYTVLHRDANLTETEKQELIDGIMKTIGGQE